nr:reverse transcriptase [Tanacetum cinerariifolium]
MPITTAKEKAQIRLKMNARSTLMMGIPNKHQLKFKSIKDAKKLMEAVEKRFEKLSQEDVNQKLLRSLPPEWNTHVIMWRNKADLDTMSMDDLYNNLKARRFLKNAERKLTINGNETIGFDMSKVECYNCHKREHFARECRAPRNQDNKNKESSSRSVYVETSTSIALVSCDGLGGYDWNEFVNKPVVGNCKAMSSEEEPKVVRKYDDAPRIEEYVLDDKEEDVSQPKIKKKIGNPKMDLQAQGVIDSRCSRHMTGNMSYLTDYEEIDRGYADFGGNPKGGKITGKSTIKTDHLGKFDGKANEGFFVRYSLNSKAFRVFNRRTRIVEENLHIRFSKSTPNVIGTQSNGFADTKASDNAGQARKETEPIKNYILLPLWTAGNVNIVSLTVNVAGINEVNVVSGKISIKLPFDPKMHSLEDDSLFDFSSDNKDDGAVADMNNLDTTIQVSPIPTIRIHKDHPLDQVIGDLQSATQTRKISKNLEEHGFIRFEDPNFPDSVYKVKTALYGLHQAPRAWYETLSTYLLDNGFQSRKIDKTLVIKRHKEVKTASTSKETQNSLLKDEDGEEVDAHMYRVNAGDSNLMLLGITYYCWMKVDVIEGSTIPTDPHHIPTIIPPSTQPQKKQQPRKLKTKDTQVPQSSDTIDDVLDEAVYKELGDSLVRVATTASSLELKQDSVPRNHRGTTAQTRFKSVSKHSNDSLLARGNTLQSDEDCLKLDELIELCTTLQNKILDLEKITTTQRNEIASLKMRVKKLEKKNGSRTHRVKRLYKVGLMAKVESFSNEENLGEDASKQKRIDAIDADEEITFKMSAADDIVSTACAATTVIAATTTTATITTEKGKRILIKHVIEHVKPIRRKDQIRLDEEAALKLQAAFDTEERLAREKAKKVEEANIVLIETWNDIQEKIDADH